MINVNNVGTKIFKAERFTGLIGDHNVWNLSSFIQCKKWLAKYYSGQNAYLEKPFEGIVYMADGRFKHGGIADRIKGMVSLYTYCRRRHIPYKIYFRHPFHLEEYLAPNEYDWRVDEKELTYHKKQAKPLILKKAHKDNARYFENRMDRHCGDSVQLHMYANSMYDPETFAEDFHKLFKPTESIQKEIDRNMTEIGGEYVSISFRFMQLLGDFKDQWGRTLNETEQAELMAMCLNAIETVREKHPEAAKVLVACDSTKFLDKAQEQFPYVYVVPGVVKHIDHQGDSQDDPQVKTFVDLLMIAKAKKAYFFARGDMYGKSQFAVVATMIGGIEFEQL